MLTSGLSISSESFHGESRRIFWLLAENLWEKSWIIYVVHHLSRDNFLPDDGSILLKTACVSSLLIGHAIRTNCKRNKGKDRHIITQRGWWRSVFEQKIGLKTWITKLPSIDVTKPSWKTGPYRFATAMVLRMPARFATICPESLNIERRYSCRAMLNFEPVAPPTTPGISQINKSSDCPHVILYMCAMVEMNCQY